MLSVQQTQAKNVIRHKSSFKLSLVGEWCLQKVVSKYQVLLLQQIFMIK
jgi:hypothetical protein